MIEAILGTVSHFVINLISTLGYIGIFIAMAIESASIPLPSEIIMPFAGFLVAEGRFNLWLVSLAGGLGCVAGSWFSYWLGARYGEHFVRYLIRKYGKYILIFEYELDEAIEWFDEKGEAIAFGSRLLPVVRTFISLPAGIAKMDLKKFLIFTFAGSVIWSYVLAWFGVKLGENWHTLGTYFHKFDLLIVIVGVLLVGYYVYHKLDKHKKHTRRQQAGKKS